MNMGILIKNTDDIKGIGQAGRIIDNLFKSLSNFDLEGMSTWELDKFIENYIIQRHAYPIFKGYRGFPAASCISIEDEIIHGIPKKDVIIKKGQLVKIDVGVRLNGYIADAAITFGIGSIDKLRRKLMEITRNALRKGIEQMKPGNHLGDISYAIGNYVHENGFNVIKNYGGHGVGIQLHEEPIILNYGEKERGPLLKRGMVFALEPMVLSGDVKIIEKSDGWTVAAQDGKPSAHFEHTIAVQDPPLVLTAEL